MMAATKSMRGLLLAAVVALIPALVVALWIHLTPGAEFRNYTPRWSDEVYNWHPVATFRAVGFDGGYYTSNERPAAISFIHFYAHGRGHPILLGTLGRLLGWEYNSGPILNTVIVTLAILFSSS